LWVKKFAEGRKAGRASKHPRPPSLRSGSATELFVTI